MFQAAAETRRCMLLSFVFLNAYINKCDGICNWPTSFQNNTWLDSGKGTLVFTTTGMTGYTVVSYGTTITSWECVDTQFFDTERILLIKSSTSFSAFGVTWWTYLCLQYTKLSDASYRYYHIRGKEPNAEQHRVYINSDGTITDKNVICDTTNAATGSAFHVMVKQGSEATAFTKCPLPLLGRFTFNYTDKDGNLLCADESKPERMDVCTDKTKLSFDTPCTGQSIVYADGEVHCVDSLTDGTTTYVQLYNPQETVDSFTTYRFSCMAISENSLAATVVYKNCTDDMTPTTRATSHDGTIIGASITFAVYDVCNSSTMPKSVEYVRVPTAAEDLSVDSITLECQTDCAYPAPTFNWYYTENSAPRQLYATGFYSSETGNCTDSDRIYSSTLTLSQYTTFTGNANKTVRLECGIIPFQDQNTALYTSMSPEITFAVAPDIDAQLSNDILKENSSVDIICNAVGRPDTYVYTALEQTWMGTVIPNTHSHLTGSAKYSSLALTSLQLQDTGNYTCHVNNGVRDSSGELDHTDTVYVEVEVPPKILTQQTIFYGAPGDSLNISIPFYSYPMADEVVFTRQGGLPVQNDDRYTVSHLPAQVMTQFYGTDVSLDGHIANLVITALDVLDLTSFTLVVTNSIGTSTHTIMLRNFKSDNQHTLTPVWSIIGGAVAALIAIIIMAMVLVMVRRTRSNKDKGTSSLSEYFSCKSCRHADGHEAGANSKETWKWFTFKALKAGIKERNSDGAFKEDEPITDSKKSHHKTSEPAIARDTPRNPPVGLNKDANLERAENNDVIQDGGPDHPSLQSG